MGLYQLNRELCCSIFQFDEYNFILQLRIMMNENNKFINMNSPLQSSGRYLSSNSFSPKKQEWALINNFKALEYEKVRQMEKAASIEKKKQFKQQLDNQLSSKSDVRKQEKDLDYRYYQQIMRKDEQLREKEELQKQARFRKMKQLEEQNWRRMEEKNSRGREIFHSSFDIGYKSEVERKNREEKVRKEVLDTLDRQLQIKAEERDEAKRKSIEQDEENIKYQLNQFDNKGRNKRYEQNLNVYEYYRQLNREKHKKERNVEHKMVDEARQRMLYEEDKKTEEKQLHKRELSQEMRETLDNQVLTHQRKLSQQRMTNPQENSYKVIGDVFRDKAKTYDKKQYFEFLNYQEKEQNLRKKKANFMNDEQYKYNLNQLNRALSGKYAHGGYVDRSVASIGEKKIGNAGDLAKNLHDEDSELVQKRIEVIQQEKAKNYDENDPYK